MKHGGETFSYDVVRNVDIVSTSNKFSKILLYIARINPSFALILQLFLY